MWRCIFWHMLLKLHCGGHSNLKIKFAKANKITNLAKSIEETELNSSSFVLFILGDNHCYSYKTMTSSSSMHSSNSDKLGFFFFSTRWGIRTPQISSILIRIGVDFQGTSRLRWEDVVNLFQIEVVKGTGTKVMLLRCCGWEDGMVFLLELGWWFLRFRWAAASAFFRLPAFSVVFGFPSRDSSSTNPFVLTRWSSLSLWGAD